MTTNQLITKIGRRRISTALFNIVCSSSGGVTSFNGYTGAVVQNESIIIACSDETTALTTGTAKVTFRMPYAATLIAVYASLTTAQASGSIFTVNIKKNGTTVLSTKITIDNTETDSDTAVTPPVISVTSLDRRDQITVDVDQIGNGTAAGLKVTLVVRQ